ncbi:MAG: glutamine-hydrolyzing carbamoyl-phosphate synthase small subunit [Bdellovibrionales bacterium]|nr:glutamine-hydrolyzing carbamoyl-phosphate synthase small subunit [Bdellovibrionales bacterium]
MSNLKRSQRLDRADEYCGNGLLALADGKVFKGRCFGALHGSDNPICGEVVFNTSMYGYQEIMTDPSYAGQIITFTYPHIGNVGCNSEDWESSKIHARGMIVRDLSKYVSNFRAEHSLPQFLAKSNIMGFCGIDTRELVLHLRNHGSQMGVIACGDEIDADKLISTARSMGSMLGKNFVDQVTCASPYNWNELPWSLKNGFRQLSDEELVGRPHVVAVDCGVKRNILRLLLDAGFRVTVVPASHSFQQITDLRPDAIFYSNGPGDPATLQDVVKVASQLVGRLPIFGICLGHQILAQAVEGTTFKLKFGHRGGNHPVQDISSGKVEITVQNHGFAVDGASLPKEVLMTHVNLNDQTVEGLALPDQKAFSLQYHPEASPGPHDARHHFKRFFEMVVR